MVNDKAPTQVTYRRSDKGTFTTPEYAKRHPNTTERERIKHPERSK